MNILSKIIAPSILSVILSTSLHASVVINLRAERMASDASGATAVAAGTLLQLVNLGVDGVFNPIDVFDGSNSGLDRWVSGDDQLLSVAFNSIAGVNTFPGDFANTNAFDMRYSSQTESTNGRVNRIFEFATNAISAGTKIGLRWFPGLLASNFGSITLGTGQTYGEFTRNVGSLDGGATPVNGGTLWVMPADGANVTFDSLFTAVNGGPESNSIGGAVNIVPVPEPASIALSLMGAAGLAMIRRRRA